MRRWAVKISLRLSHGELASLVGVSRQRLKRELNDFESKGLVSLSYSHIEVVDCTALEAIASTDLMGEQHVESD
ncbi:helix-turn-helix domain-containing protein [Burkholderia sp. THE68]|uniref:helix-turn-helix domain-containing protein n=1 Tax=Burkholderia sp. THE68 TaxID=758782 RepID=UPI0013894A44|nr:helix-turn-helix domain-containing protein [Burkholderia sp. THE68]